MGLRGKIKKGLVFIVSAPSGTGKTTLVEKLVKEFPESVSRSVSCTTREKRSGEVDSIDYYFLTPEQFQEKIEKGSFLEYTKVFNNYYGTLKESVEKKIAAGLHVILVIDVVGAKKIKQALDCTLIFIKPPSMKVLKERLLKRGAESDEQIKVRIEEASRELESEKFYDYSIINDDLKVAYAQLKECIANTEKKLCDYLSNK
jgi:guanylate kinase